MKKLKVGVVGLGFMGKMHFDVYSNNPLSEVKFICDTDKKKLAGDWSAIGGNIKGAGGKKLDLSKIRMTADFAELLKSDLDIIDVCLPTYLHSKFAVAALKAGKNCFCEKPVGIDIADAKKIASAAAKARRTLQVGQCIRFWPEYAALKELVARRIYGRVKAATFTRLSPTPTWSWSNWLMDAKKSGAAALDLHIHDTDFVNYVFGMPNAVTSRGSSLMTKGVDHIVTNYEYGNGAVIMAEGGWMGKPAFPFRMTFQAHFEKASVEFSHNGFKAYLPGGKVVDLPRKAGDGYSLELDYFLKCIAAGKKPQVVTPADAVEAVEICMAEIKSVKTGRTISL
ncbi:MAG: Gfo/Idh/MocA family oxidoreductase [Planctomycetota bacterium]